MSFSENPPNGGRCHRQAKYRVQICAPIGPRSAPRHADAHHETAGTRVRESRNRRGIAWSSSACSERAYAVRERPAAPGQPSGTNRWPNHLITHRKTGRMAGRSASIPRSRIARERKAATGWRADQRAEIRADPDVLPHRLDNWLDCWLDRRRPGIPAPVAARRCGRRNCEVKTCETKRDAKPRLVRVPIDI
ncbi:hypothetical protein L838_5148 [Mycobacterium avium MAV_120709_2344]|nr:hypothetical protein L838_5148 [Mycobacterium avium MAV_120709_2344]